MLQTSCFSFMRGHTVLIYPIGEGGPGKHSTLLVSMSPSPRGATESVSFSILTFPLSKNGLGNIWLWEALGIFKFLPLGTSPSPALCSLQLPPGDRRQWVEGIGFVRHSLAATPMRWAANLCRAGSHLSPTPTPRWGNPNFQISWAVLVLANIA